MGDHLQGPFYPGLDIPDDQPIASLVRFHISGLGKHLANRLHHLGRRRVLQLHRTHHPGNIQLCHDLVHAREDLRLVHHDQTIGPAVHCQLAAGTLDLHQGLLHRGRWRVPQKTSDDSEKGERPARKIEEMTISEMIEAFMADQGKEKSGTN